MEARFPLSGVFLYGVTRDRGARLLQSRLNLSGVKSFPLRGRGTGAPGMGINLVVKVHYAPGSRKR